jgi:hypothetical protein
VPLVINTFNQLFVTVHAMALAHPVANVLVAVVFDVFGLIPVLTVPLKLLNVPGAVAPSAV